MASLSPDQARTIAVLAGFEPSADELPGLARGLDQVRGFAADVRKLDLDDVMPWTPPS